MDDTPQPDIVAPEPVAPEPVAPQTVNGSAAHEAEVPASDKGGKDRSCTLKFLAIVTSLVLAMAIVTGLTMYKTEFTGGRMVVKEQVAPREGYLDQLKNYWNPTPAVSTSTIKTMKKVAKKNLTAKAKDRVAKAHPDRFAYLPNQGKFFEV